MSEYSDYSDDDIPVPINDAQASATSSQQYTPPSELERNGLVRMYANLVNEADYDQDKLFVLAYCMRLVALLRSDKHELPLDNSELIGQTLKCFTEKTEQLDPDEDTFKKGENNFTMLFQYLNQDNSNERFGKNPAQKLEELVAGYDEVARQKDKRLQKQMQRLPLDNTGRCNPFIGMHQRVHGEIFGFGGSPKNKAALMARLIISATHNQGRVNAEEFKLSGKLDDSFGFWYDIAINHPNAQADISAYQTWCETETARFQAILITLPTRAGSSSATSDSPLQKAGTESREQNRRELLKASKQHNNIVAIIQQELEPAPEEDDDEELEHGRKQGSNCMIS